MPARVPLKILVALYSIVIALRFWNNGIKAPVILLSIEATDSLAAVVAVQFEDGVRASRNVSPTNREDDNWVDEEDTPAEEEPKDLDEETPVVPADWVDITGMAVDLEKLVDDDGSGA